MLVKLKDISKVVGGATPSTQIPEYYNGDIVWITPKDLAENKGNKYIEKGERTITKLGYEKSNTYMIPPYNILISTRAPIGYISINTKECCTNQGFKSLICDNSKVNVDFLYYLLKTKIKALESLGTGTTFKEVSKDAVENLEIDLPSLDIQDKIANILSNIDNQIERNNAMTKRLQVLGNTIYSKTFNACKDKISFYDFPYLKLLKPGIIQFDGEKTYIPTAEVNGNNINFNSSKITFENRENRANMQPIYNSVWFAKLKNSNKHIYLTEKDNYLIDNFIFSTGFCGIKCQNFAFEYIIATIELPYFEEMKDKLAHGATMESINNDDLKSLLIPNPTKELLEQYHNQTKDIYNQMSLIRIENYKLESLKNKLLPLLINGQLAV